MTTSTLTDAQIIRGYKKAASALAAVKYTLEYRPYSNKGWEKGLSSHEKESTTGTRKQIVARLKKMDVEKFEGSAVIYLEEEAHSVFSGYNPPKALCDFITHNEWLEIFNR